MPPPPPTHPTDAETSHDSGLPPPALGPDDWGYELLLYGHEQVLRGSDNGVLVAFAALAFQQVRGGESQPHYNIGFGFMIFSVLLCGVVHFAMGNVYLGRGRRLLLRQQEKARHRLFRGANATLACLAGFLQFLCIAIGLLLIIFPDPPEWVERHLLRYFLGN